MYQGQVLFLHHHAQCVSCRRVLQTLKPLLVFLFSLLYLSFQGLGQSILNGKLLYDGTRAGHLGPVVGHNLDKLVIRRTVSGLDRFVNRKLRVSFGRRVRQFVKGVTIFVGGRGVNKNIITYHYLPFQTRGLGTLVVTMEHLTTIIGGTSHAIFRFRHGGHHIGVTHLTCYKVGRGNYIYVGLFGLTTSGTHRVRVVRYRVGRGTTQGLGVFSYQKFKVTTYSFGYLGLTSFAILLGLFSLHGVIVMSSIRTSLGLGTHFVHNFSGLFSFYGYGIGKFFTGGVLTYNYHLADSVNVYIH